MKFTESAKWIEGQYLNWQITQGKRVTLSEFAQFLGISKQLLNNFLTGRRKPTYRVALSMAEKLKADKILEILGYTKIVPLDQYAHLPLDLRERLERAIEETNRALEERGLTGDTPEGRKLTIEIFERHGFRYDTTKEEK